MRLLLTAALIAFASPALAGVDEAIDERILPGYAAFAAKSGDLAEAARADCEAKALRPAYNAAFDAWLEIAHIRLGPVEENGRALAIAFWPDSRGLTESTLRRLIADRDRVVETNEGFANVSVAARGLFALERLLQDEDLADYAQGDYSCALKIAIAADLARMADAILSEWRGGFAETMRTAGAPGNDVFLSEREASQALFTALTTGLEFNADQRVGRPMGSFARPRPNRAEARRSGRSLRNVTLSLRALEDLAGALSDEKPEQTIDAFETGAPAAHAPEGFMATDGLGGVLSIRGGRTSVLAATPRAWDNHLVAI